LVNLDIEIRIFPLEEVQHGIDVIDGNNHPEMALSGYGATWQ
jgi:hypothetical protein